MENYYNISYCKKMLTDLLSGDNTYMSPVELGDLLGEFFKSLKDPEIKAKFLENINFNDPLKARLENFFYKDSANMDTDFITKRITTYIKNHDLGSLYSALKTAQNDELTMQCLQYFDNDSYDKADLVAHLHSNSLKDELISSFTDPSLKSMILASMEHRDIQKLSVLLGEDNDWSRDYIDILRSLDDDYGKLAFVDSIPFIDQVARVYASMENDDLKIGFLHNDSRFQEYLETSPRALRDYLSVVASLSNDKLKLKELGLQEQFPELFSKETLATAEKESNDTSKSLLSQKEEESRRLQSEIDSLNDKLQQASRLADAYSQLDTNNKNSDELDL